MKVKAEYDYAQKNKANYLLNIALRGDGSIHPADQSTLQGFADLKRLIVYVTGFEQIDSSFFLSSTFENALLTGVPAVTGLPVIPFQFPPLCIFTPSCEGRRIYR